MSRSTRIAVAVVLGLLAIPTIVIAAPGNSADVRFGNPTVGSGFPPPSGHDASFNGQDNLIPRTAVISAGGSVTYHVDGFLQTAVYRAGTKPGDVAPLGEDFIDNPNGRIALGPLNFPPGTTDWTTPAGTFSAQGRYLVICNFLPHFLFANMYGWVEVK